MEKVLDFYNTYGIGVIGALILLLMIVTSVLIHKINIIQKRMNTIAVEVKRYLALVMEEDQAEELRAKAIANAEGNQQKKRQEEEQNRLISAVLEEIFP